MNRVDHDRYTCARVVRVGSTVDWCIHDNAGIIRARAQRKVPIVETAETEFVGEFFPMGIRVEL